jgi:hypothetical protein
LVKITSHIFHVTKKLVKLPTNLLTVAKQDQQIQPCLKMNGLKTFMQFMKHPSLFDFFKSLVCPTYFENNLWYIHVGIYVDWVDFWDLLLKIDATDCNNPTFTLLSQCSYVEHTLDLVTLLVLEKNVTKLHNVMILFSKLRNVILKNSHFIFNKSILSWF